MERTLPPPSPPPPPSPHTYTLSPKFVSLIREAATQAVEPPALEAAAEDSRVGDIPALDLLDGLLGGVALVPARSTPSQ